MTQISYMRGDATNPQGKGVKIIAHISNDIGGWGKGFVLAISRRWRKPEEEFRTWYAEGTGFKLGAVQFVQVEPYIWVANMIGQRGTKTGSKGVPVRYEAIDKCLGLLAAKALELKASVHMPRIGCGLAGGKWEKVEPLILQRLIGAGVAVTVYDFD